MIIHKITAIGLFSSALFVNCLVSNAASIVNIGSGSGSNNNSRKMNARGIRGGSSAINNSGMLRASSSGAINNGGMIRVGGSNSGNGAINNGRLLIASSSHTGNNAINSSGIPRAGGSSANNDNGMLRANGRGNSQRILPSSKSSIMNKVDVNLIKDKAYTSDSNADWNKFDIYLPKSDSKPPLIMFVKGGLWVKGAKEDYANMATKIASNGKAGVMVINHHMSPAAKNPTFIEDVAKAIIYAASNPDKLPYDPERLILMCHGTGCLMSETILLNPTKVAPMAAFINSIGFTDKIKGAIGVEGVYDLPKHALTVSMTDLEIIKVAMGRARKDWIDSSPALNPPDSTWTGKTLPKHFLIQSRTDELVDPIQTVNFFNHIINNSGYASTKPNLPGSHYLVLETDEFAKYISDVVGKVTLIADTAKNPQVLPLKAPNQSQPQSQPQPQPIHINHRP